MIFQRLINYWRSLRFYVIADPADNSVTLSKALFNHIKDNARANESRAKLSKALPSAAEDAPRANAHEGDAARVFVFKVPSSGRFGFMVNPDIEQDTQMCYIQYNDHYRCIGFATLCPSVGQILYDYGLNAEGAVKLSVSICHTHQGKLYYQFDKPHDKHIRKYAQG